VEAQDGTLSFESEVGKGSVFVLALPVEVVSEESVP
jgi:signal transduction histidine kinase